MRPTIRDVFNIIPLEDDYTFKIVKSDFRNGLSCHKKQKDEKISRLFIGFYFYKLKCPQTEFLLFYMCLLKTNTPSDCNTPYCFVERLIYRNKRRRERRILYATHIVRKVFGISPFLSENPILDTSFFLL